MRFANYRRAAGHVDLRELPHFVRCVRECAARRIYLGARCELLCVMCTVCALLINVARYRFSRRAL